MFYKQVVVECLWEGTTQNVYISSCISIYASITNSYFSYMATIPVCTFDCILYSMFQNPPKISKHISYYNCFHFWIIFGFFEKAKKCFRTMFPYIVKYAESESDIQINSLLFKTLQQYQSVFKNKNRCVRNVRNYRKTNQTNQQAQTFIL